MNEELMIEKEGLVTIFVRWILNGNFLVSYLKYFLSGLTIGIFSYGALLGLIVPLMKANSSIFNIVYFFGEFIIFVIYAVFLILFFRGFYLIKKDLLPIKRIIESIIFIIPIFYIVNTTFTVIMQWSKISLPGVFIAFLTYSLYLLVFFKLISKKVN